MTRRSAVRDTTCCAASAATKCTLTFAPGSARTAGSAARSCDAGPTGAVSYTNIPSATLRSCPSDGVVTSDALDSPGMRATSSDDPPPSKAIPRAAPNARISAANSGRVMPTERSGCRPSTSRRKSVPSLPSAAPLQGMRCAYSPPLGPSGSSNHEPSFKMSGPPPTAAARLPSENGSSRRSRRLRRRGWVRRRSHTHPCRLQGSIRAAARSCCRAQRRRDTLRTGAFQWSARAPPASRHHVVRRSRRPASAAMFRRSHARLTASSATVLSAVATFPQRSSR